MVNTHHLVFHLFVSRYLASPSIKTLGSAIDYGNGNEDTPLLLQMQYTREETQGCRDRKSLAAVFVRLETLTDDENQDKNEDRSEEDECSVRVDSSRLCRGKNMEKEILHIFILHLVQYVFRIIIMIITSSQDSLGQQLIFLATKNVNCFVLKSL